MKRGLVLGKFMPLHSGHIQLIDFAVQHCDELIVLICVSDQEPITGDLRFKWVQESFKNNNKIKPQLFYYNEELLPNTSESSEKVSLLWAEFLKTYLPKIDVFFASEAYAVYMGMFLECEYLIYDKERKIVPVSSTQIRNSPFTYWDFIPYAVKPFFTKKICLYGSESTGKSTLTLKLADYFETVAVPEMAREILEHTYECTPAHLMQIADLHAKTINEKIKEANKFLFVDTDVNITRSYSRFLFDSELRTPSWIDENNKFDLYLYLDVDAPYVQDGTRITQKDRDLLNEYHKQELISRGIRFELLQGNWDEKFSKAIKLVEKLV